MQRYHPITNAQVLNRHLSGGCQDARAGGEARDRDQSAGADVGAEDNAMRPGDREAASEGYAIDYCVATARYDAFRCRRNRGEINGITKPETRDDIGRRTGIDRYRTWAGKGDGAAVGEAARPMISSEETPSIVTPPISAPEAT